MYVKLKAPRVLDNQQSYEHSQKYSLKPWVYILRIATTQLHERVQYRSNAFPKPMQDK